MERSVPHSTISPTQHLSYQVQGIRMPMIPPSELGIDAPPDLVMVSEQYSIRQALVTPNSNCRDTRTTNIFLAPSTIPGHFGLSKHVMSVEFCIGMTNRGSLCLVYRILRDGLPVDSDSAILEETIDACLPSLDMHAESSPLLDLLYVLPAIHDLVAVEIDGAFAYYDAGSSND